MPRTCSCRWWKEGSFEGIPDLLVFADKAFGGQYPPYVQIKEPKPAKTPFIWIPKSVESGFRAAICGSCGHTRFYTKYHAELLEAHKKGSSSTQPVLKDILPV